MSINDILLHQIEQEREMLAGQHVDKDLTLIPIMETLEMDTSEWPDLVSEKQLIEIKEYVASLVGNDEAKIVKELVKLKSKLGRSHRSIREHLYAYIKTKSRADALLQAAKSYEVRPPQR